MVSNDKSICQNCGSKLKRYDKVSRIVRTKGGKTSWIEIERFRCPVCGQIHRELPDYVFPYKQYFKVGIAAAELLIPLMFYGIWMWKGFKFEETGTYTSTTFRGLFNRFRPTKK